MSTKKSNNKVLTIAQMQPIDQVQKQVQSLVTLLEEKAPSFSVCIRIDTGRKSISYNRANPVAISHKQLVLNYVCQINDEDTKSFKLIETIISEVLEKQEEIQKQNETNKEVS